MKVSKLMKRQIEEIYLGIRQKRLIWYLFNVAFNGTYKEDLNVAIIIHIKSPQNCRCKSASIQVLFG